MGDFLDILFDEMKKDGVFLDIDRVVNIFLRDYFWNFSSNCEVCCWLFGCYGRIKGFYLKFINIYKNKEIIYKYFFFIICM